MALRKSAICAILYLGCVAGLGNAQDYENRSNTYGGTKFYNIDSDWNQDRDCGWVVAVK